MDRNPSEGIASDSFHPVNRWQIARPLLAVKMAAATLRG
jgi:hypothetical protein